MFSVSAFLKCLGIVSWVDLFLAICDGNSVGLFSFANYVLQHKKLPSIILCFLHSVLSSGAPNYLCIGSHGLLLRLLYFAFTFFSFYFSCLFHKTSSPFYLSSSQVCFQTYILSSPPWRILQYKSNWFSAFTTLSSDSVFLNPLNRLPIFYLCFSAFHCC